MGIIKNLFKKKTKKVDLKAAVYVRDGTNPVRNYRDVIKHLSEKRWDTADLFKLLYTEDTEDIGRGTLLNILNKRRSFLCGEGIQVVCESEKHRDFFEEFIKNSKLDGSMLFALAEQLEVLGFIAVSFDNEGKLKISNKGVGDIVVKLSNNRKVNEQHPVLLDIIKDAQSLEIVFNELRTLNSRGTKITPVIGGLQNNGDVEAVVDYIEKSGWETGQPLVTTASQVQFISPNTDAVKNLIEEMTTLSQNISAKTGIPPHWLGKVQEMSNRAVAQEMYEVIEYTTAHSRVLLRECLYDILLEAQEIFNIGKIETNFSVDIPLLSASKFKSEITAIISAYETGLVTLEEARSRISGLPSITPDELIEKGDMVSDMQNQMDNIKSKIEEDKKLNNNQSKGGGNEN